MFAKTHIILGVMSSVAAVVLIPRFSCDYQTVLTASGIASGASILTSQLPDIDSVHSKISKSFPLFKKVISTKTYLTCFLIGLILGITDYFLLKEFNERNYIVFYASVFFLLSGILVFFAKKVFGHRQFTHSLVMNALFCSALILPYYLWIKEEWYLMAVVGGVMGIISHLFYDCLTTRGCPLFMPITKKNIKLLKLKSGKHDYIGVMLSFVFLFISVWFRFFVGDKYGVYATNTIFECLSRPVVAIYEFCTGG